MEHAIKEVKKGQIVRIPGAASECRISCFSGMIWLTQENDPKDYIIGPESAFSIRGPGTTVIEALADSVVGLLHGMHAEVHDHDKIADRFYF